jgi:LacI family transcriptional regulator
MDICDIAKLAGVSSATVSRVINGMNNVKPSTAERVHRVIAEAKFYPNNSATILKRGKSLTYGLIIPDITNPFFSEFIRSFEHLMVERNRDMLMATTDFHPSRVQQSIRRMLIQRVDGVALLASEIETEPIEALIHNRVPLVTMDRRLIGPGLSDVLIDYRTGMNEAIKHLKKLKHRRIGYIGGSIGPTISDHHRSAFVEAMKDNNLKIEPELIRSGNYRIPGGESAMADLLTVKPLPTAVVAANDLTAIGALKIVQKKGFNVPRDISIIGLDDIELADILQPPLTTLRLSRSDMAATFFKALEALRAEPHLPGQQYSAETRLVIRGSTAIACK